MRSKKIILLAVVMLLSISQMYAQVDSLHHQYKFHQETARRNFKTSIILGAGSVAAIGGGVIIASNTGHNFIHSFKGWSATFLLIGGLGAGVVSIPFGGLGLYHRGKARKIEPFIQPTQVSNHWIQSYGMRVAF